MAQHPFKNTLSKHSRLTVLLAGVGGTGSRMLVQLTALHRGLQALGRPGLSVLAVDPKRVTRVSLVRQNFFPAEVGLYKAQALTTRINRALGLDWRALGARAEDLAPQHYDLIISALDSGEARHALGAAYHLLGGADPGCKLHLDLGNDAAYAQYYLGGSGLPLPYVLKPELLRGGDVGPSCSEMESLLSQGLFTNELIALLGAQALWEVLLGDAPLRSGAFVNLERMALAALPLPGAPDAP